MEVFMRYLLTVLMLGCFATSYSQEPTDTPPAEVTIADETPGQDEVGIHHKNTKGKPKSGCGCGK